MCVCVCYLWLCSPDSYFIQGAVDIYKCPNVFVRQSTFSSNGFATVSKSDLYRGRAGGLSIGMVIDFIVFLC